jgi:hypothetical protein
LHIGDDLVVHHILVADRPSGSAYQSAMKPCFISPEAQHQHGCRKLLSFRKLPGRDGVLTRENCHSAHTWQL